MIFFLSLPSPLPILHVPVGSRPEQELCTVRMSQGDGVEQGGAAVVVLDVDLGTAQGQQGFQAVLVAPGGSAV